ncbi:hypothetical protein FQR65_LT00269 [Abscondita terminalis]|nr:hypothetical protein FQR65_LT00269 [Abscondita terminalis]
MKFKKAGLVADLFPNIKLMQGVGHFLFNYHSETGGAVHGLRVMYSSVHLVLLLAQFGFTFGNLVVESDDVNDLAANTITVLFFTHTITKYVYFALRSKMFYRTLGIWNQANSHPLFVESNNRYHSISLKKMRQLLVVIVTVTVFSTISWTTITFFGASQRTRPDPENENVTVSIEIPRLLIKSWYPWNAMSGMGHIASLVFQIYYIFFSMSQANLVDSMFCSWLIFACEQLMHLKEILKPLMELSATLDTYVPKTADLFRAPSANSQNNMVDEYNEKNHDDYDLSGVYSTGQELGTHYRSAALQTFNGGGGGIGPNGLTKKQEMMVRSAIKYWVERHKHVIDGVNPYAFSVIGYLLYALGQVFHFCIFGNRLIEESSSVMEAAYSCHWYDGSEEAKTFVQIVCQQCQKAMSISGAKFFTVSLDLFASEFESEYQVEKEHRFDSVVEMRNASPSTRQLDLDFLERRQNAGPASEVAENAKSPVEISPDSVDRVKVIVLGAPAVGKTSIIQQFVWNEFCEDYIPTDRKHTYYPSVITNERLYEIKISDLPVIPYFPVNSFYEWTDYRYYGLRSATAYILVFDLSNIETFQYVKTLREQICESRSMSNVPVLVVGNKEDLIATPEESTSSGKAAIAGGHDDKRRDIVNLVKKHWKSGYVECSAKYNWKVVGVFKELMNMIDSIEIRDQSPMLDNIQDALDRNKCSVL